MFSLISAILVVAVLAYVVLLIMISEYIRSKLRLSPYFTRRIIHLLAGDSIVVLPLFDSPIYPIVITVILALMVLIGLSRPNNPFSRTMVVSEYDKIHVYGPLYYILAIMVLVVVFYSRPEIVIASTMIMSWGDGFASLIPRLVSKPYMVFNKGPRYRKSIEGFMAMVLFGLIGSILGLWLSNVIAGLGLDIMGFMPILVVACIVAGVVELLSVGVLAGFDNFTVPFISAAVIYFLENIPGFTW